MTSFSTYIGIDLGGARGKTTAVARLVRGPDGAAEVDDIASRQDGTAWTDEVLLDHLADLAHDPSVVVAIDAPLTEPACVRCTRSVCPGQAACDVPSVVWLRNRGVELQTVAATASDRIAVIPGHGSQVADRALPAPRVPPLAPYTHRCTEVALHFEEGVLGRDLVGRSCGPLAARASHLRRVLAGHGFELNRNLIEVSPRATVQALFGERRARGYKRDADPWLTRASIVEDLAESLVFGRRSRLSREEVLRNDHCFDALLSGYTAFLFARDEWQLPADAVFRDDGWIWTPPRRA